MEYNTTRNHLIIPEYGRNVQKMVDHLLTIEDRDKRSKFAAGIVELMGTLNPSLKTIEDYKHKLWDHLHQIAGFKLDVDSPYPAPSEEQMMRRPDPLPYPQTKIKVRHFGKNVNMLIEKAVEEKDDEKRQNLTQLIGYYMKLAYINWHREPVHDDMIRNELSAMTEGKLQYEQGGYKVYFDTRNYKGGNRSNNKGGKGGRNNNNNRSGGAKNRRFKQRNK